MGSPDEHADPTLQHLVELTREGRIVSAFQTTHDKFRRYHEECLRLVTSAASDEQARDELLATIDSYATLFREHHEAEDDYFFPALRRAEPALDATVDELADQHLRLAAQLAIVLDIAGHVSSGTDNEHHLRKLREALRQLQGNVEDHLSFEEDSTVSVLQAWTSWPVEQT